MIYTANQGLYRQTGPRLVKSGAVLVPLIALAFIALALFTFSIHHANGQDPNIAPPSSSGQISTNTSANTAPSPDGSNSTGQASGGAGYSVQTASTVPSTSPAAVASTLNTASTSTGSTAGSTGSTPITGGMGGGSDSGSGSPASGSTSGVNVACTNLLSLAQICTVCTPPITIQPGQKAILSSDGTCVAVN